MQAKHDIMGQAGLEYLSNPNPKAVIKVWSDIAETEDLPVSYFFRSYDEMPIIEQQALQLSQGRILDVGAGVGTHSLYLQENGKDVYPLELSPLACEVMEKRGIKNVINENFYDHQPTQKYDTILFLMNGLGVAQNIDGLPRFFEKLKELLTPNGQIILDSSDLRYLYMEEDGSMLIDLNSNYYGEIIYKMSYKHYRGEKFPWIFIDEDLLSQYAAENGFRFTKILDGTHYDYMGKLEINIQNVKE